MDRQSINKPDIVAAPEQIVARSKIAFLTNLWPVRLIAYLGALMLVVVLTKLVSLPLVPAASSPAYESIVTVRNLLQAIAMIAAYSFLASKLESRNVTETAIRGAATSFLLGLAIGLGLIVSAYVAMYGLGIAEFRAGTGASDIVMAILKPGVVGTLEELVFRVILFRILQHVSGTFVAVLISASLFGLAHIGNPGATPLAMTFLTVEMGVFLALIYVLTQRLWVVAGSHMGWNFALGFVFGSDVSGLESPNAMMATTLRGSDLLTGGAFGPEGSIVTLVVSLVAISVTVWLIVRRNLWQPAKFELRARPSPANI